MPKPQLLQEILKYNEGSNVSIVDGDLSLTYDELDRKTSSFARYLVNECGLSAGDRVLIFLPGDWRFVVSLYSVIKAGGVAVPVDFRSSSRELEYIADNTGASIQIIDSSKSDHASSICRSTIIPDRKLSYNVDSPCRFPAVDPEDTAVIFYTGGTTGFPKGVPLTHRNILHILESLNDAWALERNSEVFVQFLPMTHSGGFNCSMNTCLYSGGKAILMERFNPELLLENIEKNRATVIVGVPTVYSSLVKNTDLASRDLKSVKIFFSSGAKMQENVESEFYTKTGKHVTVGWGLTEASPQLSVAPPGTFMENYVGKPLPGTEIVAVDEHGSVLADGESGILAAKGPQVMSGYWRNSEKNLEVFTRDGYLLTGDAGYVRDGEVFLLGRTKDVIISGGYKIWRSEVENALMEHECVGETAVIGIRDSLYGETVKAFIVPRCEATREDIVDFCRSRISAYKIPRIIEFRKELPKSSLGKILHKVLESEENDASNN